MVRNPVEVQVTIRQFPVKYEEGMKEDIKAELVNTISSLFPRRPVAAKFLRKEPRTAPIVGAFVVQGEFQFFERLEDTVRDRIQVAFEASMKKRFPTAETVCLVFGPRVCAPAFE